MAKQIAVIGAGLMGSGIAQVAAQAGYEVVLRDVTDAALARGLDGIKASYERFTAKGKLSAEDAGAALARITTTTDLDAVGGADMVVEAVFEQLEVKQELFRALDRIARPGAVLASNTSAIPITRIAAATERPESVVGTHFFSPVPMMQLCELVRGYKTSDETLAAAREFAEGVGKTCVVVNRDVAGFVTTRLITALVVEAVKLVRVGRRHGRGHRHRLPAGLRPCHGPAADRRPDRASTSCCTPPGTSTPRPRTRSSHRRRSWPDGHRRGSRPQERARFLRLPGLRPVPGRRAPGELAHLVRAPG